ncbi:MAG TPA: LytTR family DNA-binding domain-containing protein [Vicinamibacterales bacterium]|nr:LytTR family DNA-binding domain-containing protein [Vicinamibacterales bacterium]
MSRLLRVVLADDERPARRFLANLLRSFPDVEVVGEAGNGKEAIDLIESERPDLALLDLHMPETSGLDVARLVKAGATPSIAFVTAHDDFAIQAFELNAIDYLLKPVERERLAGTLERARQRAASAPADRERRLTEASAVLDTATRTQYIERIPVRRREETVILPVRQISSVVADGELLHLTTIGNERFTISHRLHALEARLDPRRFVRLSRGTLAALDQIRTVTPMPGGTYQVLMANGETLQVSRIQARLLRDTLLRL